jgi:hypothetical protein
MPAWFKNLLLGMLATWILLICGMIGPEKGETLNRSEGSLVSLIVDYWQQVFSARARV